MKIKTRFAPSPTGSLHIGSIRTALYSWLFARHYKGEFFLRIENTDYERSTKKSINQIIKSMKWLNIDWDHGPIFQTDRLNRYKFFIKKMLLNKTAYKCYCSKKRLKELKEYQIKNNIKPKYDRHCRYINSFKKYKKSYTIRLCNPINGIVSFDDHIHGTIKFNNEELDDLIIQRKNKIPTYNFAVVIDDYDMNITHVIRGSDHINNTPRQINILKAINAPIPEYAHLSMILGEDKKKLSKRNEVIGVMKYRDYGFLPEALLNYLVRLGWSYGNQEIFDIYQMKKLFNLKSINKSPSIFNYKKLLWLNHIYINKLPIKNIIFYLKWHIKKNKININNGPKLKNVIKILKKRCNTLNDMIIHFNYFYKKSLKFNIFLIKKYLNTSSLNFIKKVNKKLKILKKWDLNSIKNIIFNITKKFNSYVKESYMLLRIIITGIEKTPSISDIIYIIGRDLFFFRIKYSIKKISDFF
ncbi:glutamate--tRNA ligase [Sodalis-like secondary symbiont of Drepanosiphum platanoidis]|uniref:glutamate--tRNA ligase n=1 Tax=Sodalis-like secondary symbiont of Drepanosiphum platanoidis TaxID=2994493 RepID=UPI003464E49F